MVNCEKCKYCNYEYIWDDDCEDEVPLYCCKKGHNELINFDYIADKREELRHNKECPDFKEYKPKKYKEEDTECDKCDKLKECKVQGNVLNCTSKYDMRQHYIVGRCGCPKRMGC